MQRHWEVDPEREVEMISQALGRPPCRRSASEVRWDSESSQGRYVYYPERGIVFDTKHPPGMGTWRFLKERGWSADELRSGFGRISDSGARPPRPRRIPPFYPAEQRADVQLKSWQERTITRALEAPTVGRDTPAWKWACSAGGDKYGAWHPRKVFPPCVRWLKERDWKAPGLAGHVVLLMYPPSAWKAAWEKGYHLPRPERCLAVHKIAVGRNGERVDGRNDRHKTTIGAKRGCVAVLGYPKPNSPAYVVEGLADALAVHQHMPPGVTTVTSAGLDIAGPSHIGTQEWLAGRSEVALVSDPDIVGVDAFRKLRAKIRAGGGNAYLETGDGQAKGDPWDRYRQVPGQRRPRAGMSR